MEEKKNPGGRPKKHKDMELVKHIRGYPVGNGDQMVIVDPVEVYKLSALGCKVREIAAFFGVNETTLGKLFAEELQKGREDMRMALRRAMLSNACTNMNAATQIFLAKNMLDMSDAGPVNDEDQKPLPWVD